MSAPVIYAAGVESLTVINQQFKGGDPTGTEPDYEAVTDTAATAPAGDDWQTGDWDGTYDTSTSIAVPVTPTMGSSSATVELAAGSYRLFGRYVVGSETLIVDHGTFNVR